MPHFKESDLQDPQLLTSAAAEIYQMRRARDREIPQGLLGEVAWDILLSLFAEQPGMLPLSSVLFASGMPKSTALRWIGALEEQRLVQRTSNQRDGRIVLLSLTEQGRLTMERSLKAMLRVGPTTCP